MCEGRRKSQAKSEAKRRNWADPAFRLKIAEARRRRPFRVCNGLKLSESTRRKMSLAKRGRKFSKTTIARMSIAKAGRTLHPSTVEKMAASKRGQPLSEAHRAAISAGQKRRHAARRVLVAVEAAHREIADNNTLGTPIKLSSMLLSSGRHGGPSLTIEELQDQYMFQLREFRSLQAELRPWMDAFVGKHGRRPTLEDALATNVKWIGIKFQQYLVHKQKLLAEIPAMRSELERTRKAARSSGKQYANSKNGARGEVMNANASGISRVEASKRMDRAMEYKGKNLDTALQQVLGERRAAGGAALTPVTAVAEVDSPTASDRLGVSAEGDAAASRAADVAAHVGKAESDAADASAENGAASRAQSGASSSGSVESEGLSKKAAVANARVKSALAKAMQYKASKGGAEAVTQGGGSRTAVRLVPVEGKVIDGVDFSKVDASTAQAGESQFIQQGSARVTSYRRSFVDPDGDVQWIAPSASSAEEKTKSSGNADERGVREGDKDDEVPPNWPTTPPGMPSERVDAPKELVGAGAGLAMSSASYLHEFARLSLSDSESSGDDEMYRVKAPPVTPLILALRSKQAAATAALAHAAATAAMPSPEHSGLGRGGKRAAVAAAAAAAQEGADACQARDNAQQALQEFEDARRRLRESIAQRTGSHGDSLLWA